MKKTVFIFFLVWMTGRYGLASPIGMRAEAPDSLLPVRIVWDLKKEQRQLAAELSDIEAHARLSRDNRKALSRLLKLAGYRTSLLSSRFFHDLADVTVKLKLYGIAMKCYYRAEHAVPDSLFFEQLSIPAPASIVASHKAPDPQPVAASDILSAFDDGKPAASYAFLVHVKQPITGKRKAFTRINNVGHMFITLIKYNTDNSIVCRSFGFYPHKSNFLSATPLHPSSPSVIKNDSCHEWDEIAGKFISFRRFKKMLETLRSYDHKDYHLCRNNCTDFGLTMARLGGIDITGAIGRWPLGKGNNPGSAGQSMLEGKLSNTDEEYKDPLFVNNNAH